MSEPSDTVLGTSVGPQPADATLATPPSSYTYYHAGPLFTLAELTTNTRLADAIARISGGKFTGIMPQDLEPRDLHPHSIRDADIKALLSCDMAVFTYDGTELDSGTVVEYMVAKFADIPTVILRSDFRGGGDQGENGEPWNLMSSFWPRTVGVVVNAMNEYKKALAYVMESNQPVNAASEVANLPAKAGDLTLQVTAEKIVGALEKAVKMPPRLPKELRQSVYQWLALMPRFKDGSDFENTRDMLDLMHNKESKGLF